MQEAEVLLVEVIITQEVGEAQQELVEAENLAQEEAAELF
jgi:hypothetical protein